MAARCLPLRKLRMLLRLLDTGLREVLALWKAGHLQVDGFTGLEVQHLLKALFQDSEYRREAIGEIMAS